MGQELSAGRGLRTSFQGCRIDCSDLALSVAPAEEEVCSSTKKGIVTKNKYMMIDLAFHSQNHKISNIPVPILDKLKGLFGRSEGGVLGSNHRLLPIENFGKPPPHLPAQPSAKGYR